MSDQVNFIVPCTFIAGSSSMRANAVVAQPEEDTRVVGS